MIREIVGRRVAQYGPIAIVVSRFNEVITGKLLEGALDAMRRHSPEGLDIDIDIYWVPGSFEIPGMAAQILYTKRYAGILALGCLIRGETDHYDLLAKEVTKGLAQLALQTQVPVSFGIVTADNLDQAMSRAGSKQGNKGFEAAISLIEMCDMYHYLDAPPVSSKKAK